MRNKFFTAGLALALGAGCAFNAFAQVKPEVLVDQRIAAMRLQGKYLFPLVPMAQGKVPYDAAMVARNAGYLDVLIRLAWDGFDPSTQGVKSRALPEIYAQPAKFKAAQDKLFAAVTKLDVAAKAGTLDALKPAVGATGERHGGDAGCVGDRRGGRKCSVVGCEGDGNSGQRGAARVEDAGGDRGAASRRVQRLRRRAHDDGLGGGRADAQGQLVGRGPP